MNKLFVVFIFVIICALQACSENTPENGSMELTLEVPQLAKAVNASNLVAYLRVASEQVTRVTFEDSSPKTILVTSIVPDQTHNYIVNWHEVIDGVELLLSRQNGELMLSQSNPAVNLNSEHNIAFDNDLDGIENLSEREDGSCPWIRCDQDGFLIRPSDVVTVQLSNNETMTYQGASQWEESASTTVEMQFGWRVVRNSRSSIFLEDLTRCTVCEPYRGWLMEINLSQGHVLFSYNEEDDEYFKLYDIISVE